MHANSLLGTTLRDLVFLVQDAGYDAAAAEQQLLASYAMLIKSAARQYPTVRDAELVARYAFLNAIRNLRFSTNPSLTTPCLAAMRSALEAVVATAVPQQILIVIEPVAVPISAADPRLLRGIARSEENHCTVQLAGQTAAFLHFGLGA